MPPAWVWLIGLIGIVAAGVAAWAWVVSRRIDADWADAWGFKSPTPKTLPPTATPPSGVTAPVPLAPPPPTPDDLKNDRRAGYRRLGNPVLVQLTGDDDNAVSALNEGWVIDRSRQGLRLTLASPRPSGARCRVRVHGAPDTVPWLPVEVKNCVKSLDGSYELGCQFLEEPTWEVLLLFG